MKELIQQKMWIPERGVQVLLPPHAQLNAIGTTNSASNLEAERFRLMAADGTLKRRYPTSAAGQEFMEQVCFDRRGKLLSIAQDLTHQIVTQWSEINQNEPITVLIFGSNARGLVKHNGNGHPSNIDLTVVGIITEEEREKLYDAIRPHRRIVEEQMRIENTGDQPNAGVHIQNLSKITNGHFTEALKYIASGAFPLYDPAGVWEAIEKEALEKSHARESGKKNRRRYVREHNLDVQDAVIRRNVQADASVVVQKHQVLFQEPLPIIHD